MKKQKLFTISSVVIIFVIGTLSYWLYQSKTENIKINKIFDPQNCTYTINGEKITLKNGYSEKEITPDSASKQITKYFGNEVVGDFSGNSTKDTAFILTRDNGGSGIFYYVVAALNIKNTCEGTNAIFLGDRIAPQTTEFNNGEIIINYADRKLYEPFSIKPSIGVSKYLKITNGQLIEVNK